MTEKINDYYAALLKPRVVSYDLEIRRLPELKAGMEFVAIHGEEKRSEPPRGARVCWIKVRDKDRFKDLPATVTIKPIERVPVAVVEIPPRTPISPDLFEIQELPTYSFGATHIPTPQELNGVWSKVRIPAGSVFSERRITPIPAVVVGQPLKIVFRLGQIEAVAEGKALEDGRIGEKIRVLNLVSGFKCRGRIESDNYVSVE